LQIRFDLHTTIEDVKEKLRTHIGTPVQYQRLILKHNGTVITELYDNTKMLGYYSVESGMEIHIIDTDPYSLSKGNLHWLLNISDTIIDGHHPRHYGRCGPCIESNTTQYTIFLIHHDFRRACLNSFIMNCKC
jgi:hypothetical protein